MPYVLLPELVLLFRFGDDTKTLCTALEASPPINELNSLSFFVATAQIDTYTRIRLCRATQAEPDPPSRIHM